MRDANLCTGTTTVTIYPFLTTTAVLTKDLTCDGPTDATITINTNGGNGPYSYKLSINGGAYNTISLAAGNTYSVSSAGTYQFEITDANGCTRLSNSVTINPIVYPEISNLIQTQQIYCSSDTTAAITVNIDTSKGIAPFTYSINGGSYQSSNIFTGLAAGDYTVTLRDSKGCTDTKSIPIGQPTPINVTYHVVDITCGAGGVSKGSIIIDAVTGGNPNYNYFVTGTNGYNDSEINNGGTASVTFDIVDFGLYQINVVDANGCSK